LVLKGNITQGEEKREEERRRGRPDSAPSIVLYCTSKISALF